MKTNVLVLSLILLCAFVFVSCEDFDLEALGGIIGDLTGEIFTDEEEETYDYSNPGGATVEDLEGTWTAPSTT